MVFQDVWLLKKYSFCNTTLSLCSAIIFPFLTCSFVFFFLLYISNNNIKYYISFFSKISSDLTHYTQQALVNYRNPSRLIEISKFSLIFAEVVCASIYAWGEMTNCFMQLRFLSKKFSSIHFRHFLLFTKKKNLQYSQISKSSIRYLHCNTRFFQNLKIFMIILESGLEDFFIK